MKYNHNDMYDLERILKSIDIDRPKLICTDGVFSMDGDIANVPEIVDLARKYNARVYVDDAHSVGVLGPGGRGTAAHFGLEKEVDITTITFSKSFASIGGAVCANSSVINYLKHHSRTLIFSASIPAANCATVDKAIDIIQREPERIENLWKNTRKMHRELKLMGFDIGVSSTPIIPVFIGEMMDCFKFWQLITERGIFVNPVIPPAVPPEQCLIRISFMANHTEEQLDTALEAFREVGKLTGVI